MLTRVQSGESAKTSSVVDTGKKLAKVVRYTKRNESDPARVRCEWTLDFSGCTQEEMITLAIRSAVIAQQAVLRRDGITEANATGKVDVHGLLQPRGRATVDPVTAGNRAASKMTLEEKRAFAAQLAAESEATMHDAVSA